jgi:hypothetical protein
MRGGAKKEKETAELINKLINMKDDLLKEKSEYEESPEQQIILTNNPEKHIEFIETFIKLVEKMDEFDE